MTKKIMLKVPNNVKKDAAFTWLVHDICNIARAYDLELSFANGDSISPICVSGDIDLETAETIKQKALAVVRRWESRGTN